MFGNERMLNALNKNTSADPRLLLMNVKTAVNAFVKDAEQFDDLTMMCLEYKGL
jgi:sigma-B regulation protein RsbU (phosphoserine phosphatase)